MNILLVYLLLINSTAVILTSYDKYLAVKGKRRISENTLFTCSFIGGSMGMLLAMLLFRHKTSKTSFIVKFVLILLLQIALLILKLTNKI